MKFKISVKKALEVAESNLKAHITELSEANEVWTEKVKEALDALKNAIDRNGVKASHHDIQVLFLKKPMDNRANYSRYIEALKLALENNDWIEMDETEYDHLFNDNWDWRITSKLSNAGYTKDKL